MVFNYTITKKFLEQIISKLSTKFNQKSFLILDTLKLLGFHYATNSGLSINIEDLRTPKAKEIRMADLEKDFSNVSNEWKQGIYSNTERFNIIINRWNLITELLKEDILKFFKQFDPVNNLYVMAFSGARGNISQVRQLVGIRGLMADQEGRIIDSPIKTNFKEGLTSIDYIISSYGARKGIVDTALKTADAGYLTRKLIYLAQDLIIREIDCNTKHGIYMYLTKGFNYNSLLGNTILCIKNLTKKVVKIYNHNLVVTEKVLLNLKNYSLENTLRIVIRSTLTCKAKGSICQRCYGWDLAKKNCITLGELIGIIAAQSIGEPGTQLTMRTFHTGGVFNAKILKQKTIPITGYFIVQNALKSFLFRNECGLYAYKIFYQILIVILDWKKKIYNVNINCNSLLYVLNSVFVKKNDLLAEAIISCAKSARKIRYIYTCISGEIAFENLIIEKIFYKKNKFIRLNLLDGIVRTNSFKTMKIFLNSKMKISFNIIQKKSFGFLKIIAPFDGIIFKQNFLLNMTKFNKKSTLNLINLLKNFYNSEQTYSFLFNYKQYVDSHTVVAHIYVCNNYNENLLQILTKFSFYAQNFEIYTNHNISTFNLDYVNNYGISFRALNNISHNYKCNENFYMNKFGSLLKKDGLTLTTYKINKTLLNKGSIFECNNKDQVLKKSPIATVISYIRYTNDITQGIPKVMEIIEARSPKFISKLACLSGVLIRNNLTKTSTYVSYFRNTLKNKKYSKTLNTNLNFFYKNNIQIINSITNNQDIIFILKKISVKKQKISCYAREFVCKKPGKFFHLGEPINKGFINPNTLLEILFNFHVYSEGLVLAAFKSIKKFRLILLNSIQSIYEGQGVNIANKHIELITCELTSQVIIIKGPNSFFIPDEKIKFFYLIEISKIFLKKNISLIYKPIFSAAIGLCLEKDGFLVAAAFQRTKSVLSASAIKGKRDWLRGVKECIITGNLLPAGTTTLNYKAYLDHIYFFKKK